MPRVDGINYPGPWQMRWFYTCTFLSVEYIHVATINVDVDTPPEAGSDFDQYDLISRSGLFYNAETFSDAVVAEARELIKTDASFDRCELWLYEDGTENAAFQSVLDIAVAGLSGSGVVEDSQAIWSMRSQSGGHSYFELFHGTSPAGPKLAYASCAADVQEMFDVLTALASPALARDGGYLFSPLYFLPGRSEHYFKKRNR